MVLKGGLNLRIRGFQLLYLLTATSLIYTIFNYCTYDDPYITYRYAGNLASGLGFVYNPGVRVLSTTTPLFTLLLASFAYLRVDLPHLAGLVGAISLAMGGLFLWDLAHSWKSPLVGWVGLTLYPTFPLLLNTLGSETPLYLALCIGAFAFYARRRYLLTAGLAALAALARPDGLLVAVVLAADYILQRVATQPPGRHSPIPWRAVILFLGITLAWTIFAWVYFGSPLPVTLVAKQNQGAMSISQRFFPGFLTILNWYTSWPYKLEALLATVGVIFMVWRVRSWMLFIAWSVLYFAAYSILGVSRYFWYYAPLVPGFVVLVGLGLTVIGRQLAVINKLRQSTRPGSVNGDQRSMNSDQVSDTHRRWSSVLRLSAIRFLSTAFRFLATALLVLLALAQVQGLWLIRQRPDTRFAIYRAVGGWLEANTPSHTSVGALEVGIIGYYARRPMVDFAGLIQPDVGAHLTTHTTYEDAALWAVERYHPDYLVLPQSVLPRLEQAYAAKDCTPIKSFDGKAYGYSQNMVIYSCHL